MATKFLNDNKVAIAVGIAGVVATSFFMGVKHDQALAKMHNEVLKQNRDAEKRAKADAEKAAAATKAAMDTLKKAFPNFETNWSVEFDKLDADKDGVIKGDEIKAMAKYVYKAYHPHSKKAMNLEKFIISFMKEADKNGDQSIDKKEFEEYYIKITKRLSAIVKKIALRKAAKAQNKKFQKIWNKMTAGKPHPTKPDADGKMVKCGEHHAGPADFKKVLVELEECNIVATGIGGYISLFESFDADGDGHLTHKEFIDCCMHYFDE